MRVYVIIRSLPSPAPPCRYLRRIPDRDARRLPANVSHPVEHPRPDGRYRYDVGLLAHNHGQEPTAMENPTPIQRPDFVLAFSLLAVAVAIAAAYLGRSQIKLWLERLSNWFSPQEQRTGRVMLPLFVASFATLYVEIMMIRW